MRLFMWYLGRSYRASYSTKCYDSRSVSKYRKDLHLIYKHIQAILKTSPSKKMIVRGDFNLPNVIREIYSANDAETDVFLSQMIAKTIN